MNELKLKYIKKIKFIIQNFHPKTNNLIYWPKYFLINLI